MLQLRHRVADDYRPSSTCQVETLERRVMLSTTPVPSESMLVRQVERVEAFGVDLEVEQVLPVVGQVERVPVEADATEWPPKQKPCGCPQGLCQCACVCHGRRPKWMTDTFIPPVQYFFQQDGYLSKPLGGKRAEVARRFLDWVAPELVGADGQVAQLSCKTTDAYTNDLTGVVHSYFRQTFNGLPVVNANVNVNVTADGRVLSYGGAMLDPSAVPAEGVPNSPTKPAADVVMSVAETIGYPTKRISRVESVGADLRQTTVLHNPALSLKPIEASLAYVWTDAGLELGWHFTLDMPDKKHWFELVVSHEGARVLFANDYVSHATYNVFAYPLESPSEGPRTLVTQPWDTLASPFGWHDTNGVPGPDTTITSGNNVIAYTDRNNTNPTNPTTHAQGGPTLNFDFPLNLALDPVNYQDAAVTNLFYWNNIIHDIAYRYGFTEVAGNFQQNNYGRGGLGGDPVLAEAQDNANGSARNNANMATPADGARPRMQMYVWNLTNPQRDGDLDNGIIIHEYAHGITNRMTGGPSNASALSTTQARGMGEGWSDYYALMLTMKPTDTAAKARGIGTYAMGQPTSGVGIRTYRYSPDMSINPMTIGLYNSNTAVHYVGTIWASALWDMTWALIEKHGRSSDLRLGYDPANPAGDTLALRLVTDALALQPANPNFAAARNAILAADQALTGGQNHPEIWNAFARRGMGVSFVNNATSVVEAFDVPNPNALVMSHTPSETTLLPPSSVQFSFNQAMNPASFSIADDLLFTGPDGEDLKPTITGHSWLSPTLLRVDFNTVARQGLHTFVLGPDIRTLSGNLPMDSNGNLIPGEPSDAYVATFDYQRTLGPDGAGYRAGAQPFTPLNLVIGQPGVVTLVNGSDDGVGAINIGANTFNFYGTTYTGSQIFATANGLITFGTSNNAWTNGNMTSSPSQAAIAPAWDDWRTDRTAPGFTDSAVLYRLEPDRLIIEWSDVTHRSESWGAVTFQAILQLNTGSTPGTILFNYPDLALSDPRYHNAASASVGIKAAGTQGPNRLLISQDRNDHPLVASQRAIRISDDWQIPRVEALYLASGNWSQTFRERIGGDGLVVGPGATVAPWIGIDSVSVQFSKDMIVDGSELQIDGLGQLPGVTGFSYNPLTNRATWQVQPTEIARVTARLAETLQDRGWLHLDGQGDGSPGGQYARDFGVLVGDVTGNGWVTKDDTTAIRALLGRSADDPRYNPRADINGDGVIDTADLLLVAARVGNALPGQPALARELSRVPLPVPGRTPAPILSPGGGGEDAGDDRVASSVL